MAAAITPMAQYKDLLVHEKPLSAFEQLLRQCPSLLSPSASLVSRDDKGHTLATLAVVSNRDDVLRLIAMRGANIDAPIMRPAATRSRASESETETVTDTQLKPSDDTPLMRSLGQTQDCFFRTLVAHGASLHKLQDLLRIKDSPLSEQDLGIAHQYWLRRSLSIRPQSKERQRMLRELHLHRLHEIFFSLVGQQTACVAVQSALQSKRAMVNSFAKPLVLLFAGPPGHGKTELASRLGAAIVETETDFCKIDCSKIAHEAQLFGTHAMYRGGDEGSALNNFLADHDGRDGVVLLDEVSFLVQRGIMQAFLNIFDKGEVDDTRPGKVARVSNIKRLLFIMTSNQLDPQIKQFFSSHPDLCGDGFTLDASSRLESELKKPMIDHFGEAMASRIDGVVPFVPFQPAEARVIADQLLRQLLVDFAVAPCAGKRVGHTRVYYTDEVVRVIARSYTPSEGARAIRSAIDKMIRNVVTDAVLNEMADEFDCDDLTTEFPSEMELGPFLQAAAFAAAAASSAAPGSPSSPSSPCSPPAPRLRSWRQVGGIYAKNKGMRAPKRQIWFDEEGGCVRSFLKRPPRKLAQVEDALPPQSSPSASPTAATLPSTQLSPDELAAAARAEAEQAAEFEDLLDM